MPQVSSWSEPQAIHLKNSTMLDDADDKATIVQKSLLNVMKFTRERTEIRKLESNDRIFYR